MGRKVSGKSFAAKISVGSLFGEDNPVDQDVTKWAKWRREKSGNWYHTALDFDFSAGKHPEYASFLKKEGRRLAEDLTELEEQEEIDPSTWYALNQRAAQLKAYLKAYNDDTEGRHKPDPKMQAMEGLLSGVERTSESLGAAAREESYQTLEKEIQEKQEALAKAREAYEQDLKALKTECRAARISPDCLREPVYGAMTDYAKKQSRWLAEARADVSRTLEEHTLQLTKETEQQKLPAMALDYMMTLKETERLRKEAAGKKPEEIKASVKAGKTPLQQSEEKLKAMEAALSKQAKRAGYPEEEKFLDRLKKAAGEKEKPAELLELAKKEVQDINARVNKPEEDSPELRNSRRKMADGEKTLLDSIDRQGNFLKGYRAALVAAGEKKRKAQRSYEGVLKAQAELDLSLKKVPKKNSVDLDKNIRKGLKGFLEDLKLEKQLTAAEESTSEHSNSFAYKKMGWRIKEVLSKKYIDAKSLREISKAADNYMKSKGNELNFRPFSSRMRHRRLDMARNLKRFADGSIEQMKERAYSLSKGTEKRLQSLADGVKKQNAAPESFDTKLKDTLFLHPEETQAYIGRKVDGRMGIIEEKLAQRAETYLKEKDRLSEKERSQLAAAGRLNRRPGSDGQNLQYSEPEDKLRRDMAAGKKVVSAKKPEQKEVGLPQSQVKKPVQPVKPQAQPRKKEMGGPVMGGPALSH